MALDFLSGMGGMSGAGSGGNIVSGISSLLSAFGVGRPKQKYGPTPSEAQANSLFQALLDPNNSLVKQNTNINMQKGMLEFLMSLKQMQMQGARAQARGVRNAFFSPERADESINYLLTRGQPAIADNARATAKNDIYKTASALQGFAPAEQARRNAQSANRDRDYSQFQTAGGYGGMVNRFGSGLQDLLLAMQGKFPWQASGNANPATGGFY